MIKNALQKKEEKVKFASFISAPVIKEKLNNLLGSEKEIQKFTSSITSAITANPALAECDNASILSSALLANALGLSLSPSLGLAYIVPFKDNKNDKKLATFILGYKGYIQLAIRSGNYRRINVVPIKQGEFINYDILTEELFVKIIPDAEEREKAKTVGYFASFELLNGFTKTIYWDKKKMLIHADRYSPAFSMDAKKGKTPKYDKVSYADFEAGKVPSEEMWKYSSYWYQDFDGMAQKTMLRQLISKWGIMSIDMQRAFDEDDKHESQQSSFFEESDDDIEEISNDNVEVDANEETGEISQTIPEIDDTFFDD